VEMYNHWLFFSYWLVNAIIIWLTGWLFPESFVLGTWKFTFLEAAIYSGFWVTFLVWIFWDFMLAKKLKFNQLLNFGWFWLANTIGIWLTARGSEYTGLGIRAYYMAIVLGLFTYSGQRLVKKMVLKNG